MEPLATDGHPPPVCVLGMGRTGTSLTTRVIGLLGVDLGPEETMLDVIPDDNAKGFWEQTAVRELNDEILEAFGGTWWQPPPLEPGWEHDARLEPAAARASELVAEHFADGRRWGLKDPRFSMTVPFWRRLVGEMQYVVCCRNPVEVVASLMRRDPVTHDFEGTLSAWLRLSADALRNTDGRQRIFIFFEDWFDDTERQLARLADFIQPDPAERPEGWEEEARAFLETRLRHHSRSPADLAEDPRVPVEVEVFYLALREAAASRDGAALERALPGLLDLATDAQSTRERLARAEAELQAHREWLEAMSSSMSWRVTTPLRGAKRLLKGSGGN